MLFNIFTCASAFELLQEPPITFKTTTELEYPSPEEQLPADAYDDLGKLKKEYIMEVVKRAYPETHSVWTKLVVPGSLTLKQVRVCVRLPAEQNLRPHTIQTCYP